MEQGLWLENVTCEITEDWAEMTVRSLRTGLRSPVQLELSPVSLSWKKTQSAGDP